MSTTDEKLAELSALVTLFKDELPQIQDSLSQIYRALAVQETNTAYIVKQYDKISSIIEKYNVLKSDLEKLSATVDKNIEQINKLQNLYLELNNKSFKENKSINNENKITLTNILHIAPNIIAVVSFLSYIAYVLIIYKLNGGI